MRVLAQVGGGEPARAERVVDGPIARRAEAADGQHAVKAVPGEGLHNKFADLATIRRPYIDDLLALTASMVPDSASTSQGKFDINDSQASVLKEQSQSEC